VQSTDSRNLFLVCFSILLGAHLYLILTTRIYPFVDLPNHLAEATLYKYYGEPTNQFADYYSLHIGLKPNTFHTLFCSLPLFPSVEFGNRILLCMYVLLLPISVWMIVNRLGGNPWFALPSFLLLYNFSTTWGFTGFTLAIPVMLLAFYFLLKVWKGKTLSSRVAIILLFVLLFFIHALAALFSLLLLCIGNAYFFRHSSRKAIIESLVGLPVVMLVAHWWWFDRMDSGPDTVRFLWEYYSTGYVASLPKRIGGLLLFDNYSLFEGTPGFVVAFFFAASILLPLLLWKFKKQMADHDGFSLRSSFILFGCSVLCFFLLPDKLPGEHYIFHRFSVFALLSVSIMSSVLYAREPVGSLKTICIMFSAIHMVMWFQYFGEFSRTSAGFTSELFPEHQQGKRLAGLISDYNFRGRPIYNHFSDYYIVWKQGIAASGITDLRFGFVNRKVSTDILPGSIDWGGKFAAYDGRFSNVDYLLARGVLPPDSSGGLDRFARIRSVGEWHLYER
jgi:hypothetical protein